MTIKPIIVYVEDDEQSRDIMRLLLENQMNITDATYLPNSENFLERVEALNPKPTLFLLDIHVKPYSGFQMLAMLRQSEKFKDVTTLALTASVMNEEVQQLKEAGFNGVIAKPVDMDTFSGFIERALMGQQVWSIKE